MTVRLRRCLAATALVLSGLAVVSGSASGSQWSVFGGDAGRSGYQPLDNGTGPIEALWSRTEPSTRDVLTSVIVSAGPPGLQRVIYGTGDHHSPEGEIVGGRVHVRTLLGGAPVTPAEGLKMSDEPDAFGDGLGSVSFADTSTADALGQVWMVYNDLNGVSIAQIDEATGVLVQKKQPNPADISDKLVGISINSSVLLSPPDPAGGRFLVFTAFGDVTPVETLYRVIIANAGSRDASITSITTANGDFNLVDLASPSLVYLTTNASNNEAHVAVGDCRGRLYTFAADDLAPGPVAGIGADTDCVLTASAPVTANGNTPGAPGSGFVRTPVIYVATTDAEAQTTRVHRLIQETSVTFRKEPDNPPVLPGGPASALAVDAVVVGNGTLAPGGRVYVTTGKNLYVLDAKELRVVAKLVPDDDLVPGDTGFSLTTPSVTGSLLFLARDNGDQLVLDKRTLAPLPPDQFRPLPASLPVPGSSAVGSPSLAEREVIFATSQGVFAYRGRGTGPPSGYWLAAADGGVFAYGDAGFFGSAAGQSLAAPISALAPTPTGAGYWLVGRTGEVYPFGDAISARPGAATTFAAPVVGMASTPTGRGYWLVAADGAVVPYGDAAFVGSAGGQPLAAPVVGMAATPTGLGYWLVAGDGAVFAYGDAGFFGSMGGRKLNAPVVGLAPAPNGNGYWLVGADGGVFAFGAAAFLGSGRSMKLARPMSGIAGGTSGRGYTLTATDGGVFAFGDAAFYGSAAVKPLNAPVVAIATKG